MDEDGQPNCNCNVSYTGDTCESKSRNLLPVLNYCDDIMLLFNF